MPSKRDSGFYNLVRFWKVSHTENISIFFCNFGKLEIDKNSNLPTDVSSAKAKWKKYDCFSNLDVYTYLLNC